MSLIFIFLVSFVGKYFAFVYPDFDTDLAVGQMRSLTGKIDVRAKGLQGYSALL